MRVMITKTNVPITLRCSCRPCKLAAATISLPCSPAGAGGDDAGAEETHGYEGEYDQNQDRNLCKPLYGRNPDPILVLLRGLAALRLAHCSVVGGKCAGGILAEVSSLAEIKSGAEIAADAQGIE